MENCCLYLACAQTLSVFLHATSALRSTQAGVGRSGHFPPAHGWTGSITGHVPQTFGGGVNQQYDPISPIVAYQVVASTQPWNHVPTSIMTAITFPQLPRELRNMIWSAAAAAQFQ